MRNTSTARVAVIIPVYRALYLKECLTSVFAQTRPADEVIVVDDGSPDGDMLRQALEEYAGRVTLIAQPNQGAGAARNTAIRSSTADLLAFLDADDMWEPQFLETQLRLLDAMPHCALVYADGRIVGDGPLAGRRFMDTAPSNGSVTTEALLAQRCTVLTSSVVARRRTVEQVGLFDESLRRGQDFDLWVRIAHRRFRIAYTEEPLVRRRVHAHNLSGDQVMELERALNVLKRLAAKLHFAPVERGTLRRRIQTLQSRLDVEHGKRSLRAGDLDTAAACFTRAAGRTPQWRLRAASVALHSCPRLTRRLYLLKTRRTDALPAAEIARETRSGAVAAS